jgi:organic radical activating enzyme
MAKTEVKAYRGATPDPAAATHEAMAVAHDGALPIVEVFYSLQGEGLRVGQATIFVRVAGCNLACDFCDTDFRVRETYDAAGLVEEIRSIGGDCRWVCLTGGEPTIHDLRGLCGVLHSSGYSIQMETNGTRPQPAWELEHITVSPKEPQGGRLAAWYGENASEFKYVVDGPQDVERAVAGARAYGKATFLQPNALNPEAGPLCVAAVCRHPDLLRLSLQTHKLLGIR